MLRTLPVASALPALAVAASLSLAVHAHAQERRSAVTGNPIDTHSLTAAFDALKGGDTGPLATLPAPTVAAIPAIRTALSDDSEAVRREAVTLLSLIEDPEAAPALAQATLDASTDVAARAATALYVLGPDAMASDPAVAEELRRAVDGGLTAGAAVLMLAHVPTPAQSASIATLRTLRATRGDMHAEVFSASPVVPAAMMADVALTKLGEADAHARLLDAIRSGDLNTLEFLLSALREIEAADLLEALAAATLSDHRPVDGDVVSSAGSTVRLADVAAVRFAARFGLPVAVGERATERLSDETLRSVSHALTAHLKGAR
ncbi:MAG: HEAT repeat domain-containing protein [Pseudomonadota bacterium]